MILRYSKEGMTNANSYVRNSSAELICFLHRKFV